MLAETNEEGIAKVLSSRKTGTFHLSPNLGPWMGTTARNAVRKTWSQKSAADQRGIHTPRSILTNGTTSVTHAKKKSKLLASVVRRMSTTTPRWNLPANPSVVMPATVTAPLKVRHRGHPEQTAGSLMIATNDRRRRRQAPTPGTPPVSPLTLPSSKSRMALLGPP
jgi:hypothetical protein